VLPSAKLAAAETQLPPELPRVGGPAGSDFMVDVIKSLNIEYTFANPASSFRGLHESLLTYGKNTQPEFITCMHEEPSAWRTAISRSPAGDRGAGPWDRRPAARHHGDLQRLV
jgi:hypothetical protein